MLKNTAGQGKYRIWKKSQDYYAKKWELEEWDGLAMKRRRRNKDKEWSVMKICFRELAF
jgi:hypothetical protein